VLNTWSPASGTILGDSGHFRRWDLAGGSKSLEVGPLGYLVPGFFLLLSFLSAMP
jgi:hypothetical protein